MAEIKEMKKVLKDTKKIIKHQQELTIAKGDHFNLFSVLDIETKENKTHSAFLAELLNPNGSHLLGNVFLNHFLTVITHQKEFNTDRATVKVEHTIPGNINLHNKEGEDKSKATGGRIDIYIKDKLSNSISIENKIHATDQEAQIQRYYNYKTANNTVYYLTLKGEDPAKYSCLKLKSGEDFFNISYRETIVAWLELCLKEVPNFTSLREAINQYILLIKKLTKTMNTEHDKELLELMMANIEESSFIASNYDKVLNKLKENFRSTIIEVLEKKLNKEYYTIEAGKPVSNKFSQIWIHLKNNPQPTFFFGVESFSGSGHRGGDMFVGIFSNQKAACIIDLPDENSIGANWKQVRFLQSKDLNPINLSDTTIIKILNNKSSDSYKTLLKNCCDIIIGFVEDYEKKLLKEIFLVKKEDKE